VLDVRQADALSDDGEAAAVLMRVGHEGIDGLQDRVGDTLSLHLSADRSPSDVALLRGVLDLRLHREEEAEEGAGALRDAREIGGDDAGLEWCGRLHDAEPFPRGASP
jgi:hypothetical protein